MLASEYSLSYSRASTAWTAHERVQLDLQLELLSSDFKLLTSEQLELYSLASSPSCTYERAVVLASEYSSSYSRASTALTARERVKLELLASKQIELYSLRATLELYSLASNLSFTRSQAAHCSRASTIRKRTARVQASRLKTRARVVWRQGYFVIALVHECNECTSAFTQ